jgi:hypothetical protein
MVESIYWQGFAYAHEMEERRKKIVKLGQKVAGDRKPAARKKLTRTLVLCSLL